MSTLGFSLDNIDQYDPDAAPDGDETPACPTCDGALTEVGDHLECLNVRCGDCNWYEIHDGQLVKTAPAF